MVDNMKHETISRRTFLKRVSRSLFAGFLLASGGYGYVRFVEPKRLSITHQLISHSLIPKGFNGKTIVQFSDTHLSEYFTIEQLLHIVEKINAQKPDIVVFTGDLVDEPNRYNKLEEIIPYLQKISAPLGMYAIFGNHDHGGYGTELYESIMKNAGFQLLQNNAAEIKLNTGEKIYIAGIDDFILGRPDWDETFRNVDENVFTILLAHEPDSVQHAKLYPVHLQLSGHSHGGQIKLPFVGPLYTPPYASIYHEGLYEVNNTMLYVNRGLGTTRLPFRFLSVPELTVFTLSSKSEGHP